MGGCFSESLGPEEQDAKLRSNEIDKQLKKDKSIMDRTIKLLLLGAGESGKSTVVKQMKIIHGDGFTDEERESYKSIVHDNLLISLKSVIEAMDALGIALASSDRTAHKEQLMGRPSAVHAGCTLSNEDISSIRTLLADEGVSKCIRRGYEYQLIDSAPYFFNNADRILSEDYLPTENDVLRCRVRTTGITVTKFRVKKNNYHIVDVGGQRSERRKWIQCFDDVRAVLFVCAMSGYDMTLLEDGRTNRLDESLNLFQSIVNNKFFEQAAMILFLNKLDLFRDKIENSSRHMRLYFPQYQGPDNDANEAKKFVESEFRARVLQRNRIIYPHFTTATDTSNIRVVIDVVVTQIIRDHMKDASLL